MKAPWQAVEDAFRDRVRDLCRDLEVALEPRAPLSRFTSVGVGGPAPAVLTPSRPEAAGRLLEALDGEAVPYRVLGNGTNLLVQDAGVGFFVVRLGSAGLEPRIEGTRVVAPAGMSLPTLARLTARRGLRGLEHAEGIPGSVGGSTAGNAGCYGGDMGGVVRRLRLLADGRTVEREVTAEDFGYRQAPVEEGEVILEVEMRLEEDEPEAIRQDTLAFRRRRLSSQPVGVRSAGCVFMNPEGESAGRLIDEAGLKGAAAGGARVSEAHANFLVNDGSATADDFHALIERVVETVEERFGVTLQPEVRFWPCEEEAA